MANALAPKAKNAFVQNPLQDLLEQSAAYPQYNDLMSFLSARNAVPQVNQRNMSGGEFVTQLGVPNNGVINLQPSSLPRDLTHELTHAADRQIRHLYSELNKHRYYFTKDRDLTPEENQFLFAYDKMVYGNAKDKREEFLNKLAPEWAKKESRYRSAPNEAAAYGFSSQVGSNQAYHPAPLHVDPTMGTEFSILLDLAQRAQLAQAKTGKK